MTGWLQLTKAGIPILVALSAVTGHVLAGGGLSIDLASLALGTWLLASGAAALNQFQERRIDARMIRTRSRPLPSGRIHPRQALVLAGACILAGGILLARLDLPAAGLGMLAVVWYNGLYTWLKRRSRFAVVPGAVIGSIPPAIGWVTAGGDPGSGQLWAVMFFMFLWQVPHFWLLLLRYPADCSRAGLPDLATLFSERQLRSITVSWILATVAAALMLPLFGLLTFLPVYLVLAASGLWLSAQAARLLGATPPFGWRIRRLSSGMHAFVLVVLAGLVLARILAGRG